MINLGSVNSPRGGMNGSNPEGAGLIRLRHRRSAAATLGFNSRFLLLYTAGLHTAATLRSGAAHKSKENHYNYYCCRLQPWLPVPKRGKKAPQRALCSQTPAAGRARQAGSYRQCRSGGPCRCRWGRWAAESGPGCPARRRQRTGCPCLLSRREPPAPLRRDNDKKKN